MGTSKERDGIFGKYTEHFDDSGKKIGESRERTGIFGDYTEHTDSSGRKTGESRERRGLLGDYTEHTDSSGRKDGESRERRGLLGDYTEHTDSSGRKVGESRKRGGIFGRYVSHSGESQRLEWNRKTTDQVQPGESPSGQGRKHSTIASQANDGGGSLSPIAIFAGLIVLFLAFYFGLPILAGYLAARTVNRRWINPVDHRHRLRWFLLPLAFTSAAVSVNEFIASGFMATSCSEPQSISCSNYLRRPAPTVFGLHLLLAPKGKISYSDQDQLRVPSTTIKADSLPNASTSNNQDGIAQTGVYFGAIARSYGTGKLGYSWRYGTQLDAEGRANQECGLNDCINVLWFRNGFGAFVQADDDVWRSEWGSTQSEAEQNALNICQQSSRVPNSCRTKVVVSSSEGVINALPTEQAGSQFQTSCGSPRVSGGTWWPVLGPKEALETVRRRFCGDAYVRAEGTTQVASFSDLEAAKEFAQRISHESGLSLYVGEPRSKQ